MSGWTPVAMSSSTARITSTETPLRSMIPIDMSPSACVFDTSGERFSVQLMNSAFRSEKSQLDSLASCSCLWARSVIESPFGRGRANARPFWRAPLSSRA